MASDPTETFIIECVILDGERFPTRKMIGPFQTQNEARQWMMLPQTTARFDHMTVHRLSDYGAYDEETDQG
jgi:hypothetical protein